LALSSGQRFLTDIASLVEADAFLSKSYESLTKAMVTIEKQKRMANRLRKRCFRLRLTQIPAKVRVFFILPSHADILTLHQICKASTTKNEHNGLFKLPSEVQSMIFKALPSEADRACLALTCKDLAGVYEQLKKEKNKKDYVRKVPKRVTDVHRLQLLVRLKVDLVPQYRLCYHCLQFIDVIKPINDGQWGGSEAEARGLIATKAAMVKGPRCPLCVAAKNLEAVNYKDTYKKYLALADKIRSK
jgi:hypothetical protein